MGPVSQLLSSFQSHMCYVISYEPKQCMTAAWCYHGHPDPSRVLPSSQDHGAYHGPAMSASACLLPGYARPGRRTSRGEAGKNEKCL